MSKIKKIGGGSMSTTKVSYHKVNYKKDSAVSLLLEFLAIGILAAVIRYFIYPEFILWWNEIHIPVPNQIIINANNESLIEAAILGTMGTVFYILVITWLLTRKSLSTYRTLRLMAVAGLVICFFCSEYGAFEYLGLEDLVGKDIPTKAEVLAKEAQIYAHPGLRYAVQKSLFWIWAALCAMTTFCLLCIGGLWGLALGVQLSEFIFILWASKAFLLRLDVMYLSGFGALVSCVEALIRVGSGIEPVEADLTPEEVLHWKAGRLLSKLYLLGCALAMLVTIAASFYLLIWPWLALAEAVIIR